MSFRKYLSIPGLLIIVRSVFSRVPDHRKKNIEISLPDALMSALAMFLLKYPSLLQFDEERNKEIIQINLKNLYGIDNPPCDTQMRDLLDPTAPSAIRPAFVSVLNQMQAGGALKEYKYFDDH